MSRLPISSDEVTNILPVVRNVITTYGAEKNHDNLADILEEPEVQEIIKTLAIGGLPMLISKVGGESPTDSSSNSSLIEMYSHTPIKCPHCSKAFTMELIENIKVNSAANEQ